MTGWRARLRRVNLPPGLGTRVARLLRALAGGTAPRTPPHERSAVTYTPLRRSNVRTARARPGGGVGRSTGWAGLLVRTIPRPGLRAGLGAGALASASGRGDFIARFETGERLEIHPRRARIYADFTTPPTLGAVREAASRITPGSRVLVLGGGTGWIAAELARAVGPAGAVVTLDRDRESCVYAALRYSSLGIASEREDAIATNAEPDGSFDAAVVDASPVRPERFLAAARLVAQGGPVLAIADAPLAGQARAEILRTTPSLAYGERRTVGPTALVMFRTLPPAAAPRGPRSPDTSPPTIDPDEEDR